jgi:photosystem II stability/assembly factor-like uncharacterized protein
MRLASLLLAITLTANAQWTIQDSKTTASLRGIDSVGNGVAWASGTEGTVLRTDDGGATWQKCSVPPDAEALDFRGVQAFDAKTAIVMSSGKGDLSRLYKTTDGCQTWKLVFSNPDKDGFWDALRFSNRDFGALLGDPVNGIFARFITVDGGSTWLRDSLYATAEINGEAAFAASNSTLVSPSRGSRDFCTGGASGGRVIFFSSGPGGSDVVFPQQSFDNRSGWRTTFWSERLASTAYPSSSSGCFSMAIKHGVIVAVGGDYTLPNARSFTAWTGDAYSTPSTAEFAAATNPPHGYRSAVAYDAPTKTWITVGPNGTDISTDDGRNWRALKPGPGEPDDADQHWNALSLPFVVGPKGRIGRLEPEALKAAAK